MQTIAYTVSQLTLTIKNLLEGQKMFQNITLKGEISNFTEHRTGHLYFALKDDKAQIKAIMFSSHAVSNNFKPKDGDKVSVTGNITLYAPQGTYSIQVTKMKIDGEGELYLRYLELKENLKKLGWFDKARKQLPKYPKVIGVVTSPTGAVIEDILNTINHRYPLVDILLYPALVQGIGSSKSISKQIYQANKDKKVDVLIVGRGGGSIEDLWGFNEIETIEAIYKSEIPIISAIGHETDTTLSDYVSDLRAPTPTGAAMLATPDRNELLSVINETSNSLVYKMTNLLNIQQNSLVYLTERIENSGPLKKLDNYKKNLKSNITLMNSYFKQQLSLAEKQYESNKILLDSLSPTIRLNNYQTKITTFNERLALSYLNHFETNNTKFEVINKALNNNIKIVVNNNGTRYLNVVNILEKINPLAIMKRGFTLIKSTQNEVITSVKSVKIADEININFNDGNVNAKVISIKEEK